MQDIDLYYESLKEVYDQIEQWPLEKPSLRKRFADGWFSVNAVLLVLSIIPIIPIILYSAIGYFRVNIWTMDFSQFTIGNLIVTWIVVALLFGTLFPIINLIEPKQEKGDKPKGPPQRLSPDQLSFIAIYEAYKEMKIYFISHIDHHIERCKNAVSRTFPVASHRINAKHSLSKYELDSLGYDKIDYYPDYHRHYSMGSEGLSNLIYIAESFLRTFEKYEWLNLDNDTKIKIQALIEFPDKILFRLLKKEDLPSVLLVLESLARFTYAYLPEHKTYMESATIEELRKDGDTQIKKFVQEVNAMTSYTLPQKLDDEKPAVKETLIQRFKTSGYSEVLFRFSAWFILILTLTSITVYLASLKLILNSDTMATLIIGTSVGGAAALCAVLPRATKKE